MSIIRRLTPCLLTLFLLLSPSLGFAEECELLSVDARHELRNCGGVRVVHLMGSPDQRAETFGQMIREQKLSRRLLDYFSNRVLNDVPEGFQWLATPLLNWYAHKWISGVPTPWAKEIEAMAKGLEQPVETLERALTLPDLANHLNAYSLDWPLKELPPMGCTSAARRNSDGSFVYGRNLDFSSVGLWDARPLMVVHMPEANSKELRHIAIGSDGVLFAGITGVNEAGITLAVHQNYTQTKSFGIPMFFLGEMLLREVSNLDAAKAFFEKYRPGTNWTFVVTDLRLGEAIAIEASPEGVNVRPMDGDRFAQTNHLDGKTNVELIRPATLWNSRFRMEKAMALLKGDVSPSGWTSDSIYHLLAFRSDLGGELSGYRDIIKPHTIQTAVFERKSDGEWQLNLSRDPAPTASGSFVRWNIASLLQPEEATRNLSFESHQGTTTSPEIRKNQEANSTAFRQSFDERNDDAALATIAKQSSVGAKLFRAIVDLKEKRYSEAYSGAEAALKEIEADTDLFLVKEGLTRVMINASVGLEQYSHAKELARQALGAGTTSSELLDTARILESSKSLPLRLRVLHYDFFSGNLRTKAAPVALQ